MKTRNLASMVVVLLLLSAAQSLSGNSKCLAADGQCLAADKEPADEVLGKFWFPKKNGKLEVTKKDGIYTGKVIEYDEADALDKNNPDPELAKRKFVGIEMLSNFSYDPKKKQWNGGTIYDGESGKTYKCSLWFEKGDTSVLMGRGYVGVSLFGRNEKFERVKPDEKKPDAKTDDEKKDAAKK